MAFSLDICMALCARAHAQRQWPEIGFSDQFASMLAQLLGISLKQRLSPAAERRLIQRSQWFDEVCRDFLHRHPKAMCIELGAGLSTRFHRLSSTADWPRFQWVDVDLPHVTVSKAAVLPAIDNYRLVSADIANDDWLSLSGWVRGQPLLILLEGVASELKGDALLRLIYRLQQSAHSAQEIEVVLDDVPASPWPVWQKLWAFVLGETARLPITSSIRALEARGFYISQQKSLLGNAAVGVVMNYKHQEWL
jgi:O-methyltransferase involved in polyketide biosynthesis